MDMLNPKTRLILALVALGSFLVACGLCLYWYDWKLIVILFILQFSWNIDNQLKMTRNK